MTLVENQPEIAAPEPLRDHDIAALLARAGAARDMARDLREAGQERRRTSDHVLSSASGR